MNPGNGTGCRQVGGDLPCLGCGYNLRMLAEDATCPECGRAVRETLGFGLSHMRLEDLAALHRQAQVHLAVLILGPIPMVAGILAGDLGLCLVLFVVCVGGMAMWLAGSGMGMTDLPCDRRPRIGSGMLVCLLPFLTAVGLIMSVVALRRHHSLLIGNLLANCAMLAMALWFGLLHYRVEQIATEGGAETLRRSAVVTLLLLIFGTVLILLFAVPLSMRSDNLPPYGLVILVLLLLPLVSILHIVVLCQLSRLAGRSLKVRRALDAFAVTPDEGDEAGDSEACA